MKPVPDQRHITNGHEIPTDFYCDQPYIVKTDDGAWLCAVTTGSGYEGESGQHVISMRSTDKGKTWSQPVPVEPPDGPEASYAVMLKVPSGRIYIFYNHNTDNIRWAKADEPPFEGGKCTRVDSLGHYVFKYSDDHGRTWSARRYDVPMRIFEIDRRNPYGGELKFFWNVGRPFIFDNAAYCSLHKVGGFGHGFFTSSEGVLLRSENILTERDPEKITWETLPEGEIGLRTPPGGGPVSEEHSYCTLSDGSFYCVYRSIDGHPVCSYSRDQGRTWSLPQYKRYADGTLMKHPRAANFAWKCTNGKFIYWFHNHGGRFIAGDADITYNDRNPVWLCGGVEADSSNGKIIKWLQPEIAIYDDDTYIRMSYPDLVEEDGEYFITETQKEIARVHTIDPSLLEKMWGQMDNTTIARNGIIMEAANVTLPSELKMPALPIFNCRDGSRGDHGMADLRKGFSIDLWLKLQTLEPGQIILDNRDDTGKGFCLRTATNGVIEIVLNDGRTENRWTSDPELLRSCQLHHIAVIVDGGPKIISFVIDGLLNDGGVQRQFGWGRFSPHLRDANGGDTLRVGQVSGGAILSLRIYDRALRTSEAVGNFNAGA